MSENTTPAVTPIPETKKSLKRFLPSKKTLAIAGTVAATAAAVAAYVKGRQDGQDELVDDLAEEGVTVEYTLDVTTPDDKS